MVATAPALTGGCHCGQVRYEAAGRPRNATVCHCSDCRRVSGAPILAWFTVDTGGYRIVQGTPQRYRSSAKVWRTFCGACGTPLTYQRDDTDEIDVTTCSLDEPEAVPPTDQTFGRSRLHWVEDLQVLPAHLTTRPG
ncbi:GFA family protein [Ramlibacter sp. Leaf400]|uniref:GFA family protein n=1 Tax=Ramlibacter sp. Leaf400 TaxID=1736365 RepID=UPI0006F3DE6E|nr:GFA family protein [Ramlibacter sp. Leaf400]KQT09413.1 aldehyde-activating protein [Ramlibacter sp. Leaf400]